MRFRKNKKQQGQFTLHSLYRDMAVITLEVTVALQQTLSRWHFQSKAYCKLQ